MATYGLAVYKQEWVSGAYEGQYAVDLGTISELTVDSGGGDDYTMPPVSVCRMRWKNGTTRWAIGTQLSVSVTASGGGGSIIVFTGQLMETKYDNATGYTDMTFRGLEFRLYRRKDGVGANGNVGPRASLSALWTASGWGWTDTDLTARFIGVNLMALNRPAQAATMRNGEWIQYILAGTSQNMVVRHNLASGNVGMAPDRLLGSDISANGFLAGYLSGNFDADKISISDAGHDLAWFSRKFTAQHTNGSTSNTQTNTGISSLRLEELDRVVDGYYRTNADAQLAATILSYRQGSNLNLHRIFGLTYWPNLYDTKGGAGADKWWKLQPGDQFTFSNRPTPSPINVGTYIWSYDYPNGTTVGDNYVWDVRRVLRTWTPTGGWRYDLGCQPRTDDSTATLSPW
jgi:hypothetical protein